MGARIDENDVEGSIVVAGPLDHFLGFTAWSSVAVAPGSMNFPASVQPLRSENAWIACFCWGRDHLDAKPSNFTIGNELFFVTIARLPACEKTLRQRGRDKVRSIR